MKRCVQLKLIDLTKDFENSASGNPNESFKSFLRNTVDKCGVEDMAKDNCDPHKKQRFGNFFFMRGNRAVIEKDNDEIVNKIVTSIIRYVKLNDRYIALASLLTKSYLHHYILGQHSSVDDSHDDSETPGKRIRTLPRTRAGKPYIPFDESERSLLPFSISHQFPFVGLAYFDERMQSSSCSSIMVGLDIVMFSSYKETKHIYSSVDEFLTVFKDSFSPREWNQLLNVSTGSTADINNTCRDSVKIKEFFIRWSIKEAYTKALGTGMGTDFKSFDTRLYSKEGSEETQLWKQALCKESGAYFQGQVTHTDSNLVEKWDFVFIPLFDDCTGNKEPADPVGCACICVGPKNSKECEGTSLIEVAISSSTLKNLIDYHITT
mmetsp:Transcript_2896/g.4421  ORF Transcript_2896/g.4421 Transcript_2896/m.4421 type:complete len:378 (+) Transcript_2896:106-1239(+)